MIPDRHFDFNHLSSLSGQLPAIRGATIVITFTGVRGGWVWGSGGVRGLKVEEVGSEWGVGCHPLGEGQFLLSFPFLRQEN